jgi:hypothetical protein
MGTLMRGDFRRHGFDLTSNDYLIASDQRARDEGRFWLLAWGFVYLNFLVNVALLLLPL